MNKSSKTITIGVTTAGAVAMGVGGWMIHLSLRLDKADGLIEKIENRDWHRRGRTVTEKKLKY